MFHGLLKLEDGPLGLLEDYLNLSGILEGMPTIPWITGVFYRTVEDSMDP